MSYIYYESDCIVGDAPEPSRGYAACLSKMENNTTGVVPKDTACSRIRGVGPDAPTVVASNGAKQSHTPYRCDLLPAKAILHIANILDTGAKKYGDENWRGLTIKDHLNHALVHIFASKAGDDQDDHLGHAACRILMALDTVLSEGK